MHSGFSTNLNPHINSNISNNSERMLYGGPLGTYLSGIYQPVKPASSNPSSKSRRGHSRTGNSNLGISPSSNSSHYYTPQPRRRTETQDYSKYNLPASSSSSSYNDSLNTSRTRPRSYYNSSPSKHLHSPSPSSSVGNSSTTSAPSSSVSSYTRPSSMIVKSSNDTSLPYKSATSNSYKYNKENENNNDLVDMDYKKLYEEEKGKTTLLKKEIDEVEKELEKIKCMIQTRPNDDNNKLKEINIANDVDLKELEMVKCEGDKLKAEHRALSRVVARLSREK